MRISFGGRSADIADIPITDDSDGPAAKALNARIQEVCRYARDHVIDAKATPAIVPRPVPDPRHFLTVGPLMLVYIHFASNQGTFRQLTIGMQGAGDADGLPPPEHCAVIAKMFGFTGEMFTDYQATAGVECTCGMPGCTSLAVACLQKLPSQAS